ncbi:hypothetical protein [Haloferax volcanii]|uniref:SWIM zinc finger domain protein n=3 Tax=Haloferax volcanii TaxID=2246 RepID=D4GZY8_HALVD|nr:hypothetical protein [Haloferax volcanii]ADE03609.1 SWIM zinc finger domain protein [Haloferax volcanii DS2]ELY25072.1 hypothetical protein C498_16893 [Haloferax volcanii DS2]MBS8119054.1 hypothetical protein [Haloferax volcanii]MBS8124067.1 hypothetical protein [Haloferax volcanii]MBS8127936.1 hypothetical protein [Haloferax volcanii]
MQYLDFKRERDEATTSWERGDPVAALVERTGPTTYLVTLPGGETHAVEYGKERGTRVGGCDCKGFEFRDDEDSPCAHLCVLRKAEWSHNHFGDAAGRDVTDDPITAHDTAEHVAPNATEPEPDLVADGGEDFPRQNCRRCGAVSPDGEAPPPAECSEGTTDDPEHEWTDAPDLVADGGDIVEAPTTGHDGRVFGRPEDQL